MTTTKIKTPKTILIERIMPKPFTRGGETTTPKTDSIYSAEIVAGKTIRIFGKQYIKREVVSWVAEAVTSQSPATLPARVAWLATLSLLQRCDLAALIQSMNTLSRDTGMLLMSHEMPLRNQQGERTPEQIARSADLRQKNAMAKKLVGDWIQDNGGDEAWNGFFFPTPNELKMIYKDFDRTFSIGDSAEYDSYNAHYVGTITAISAKTVTIREDRETKRLDLYEFIWRNWNLNLEEIARRNHDVYMSC